jgi:hypothetical protein
MTVRRKAACACGQLSIEVEGDPPFEAICACSQCQKRTGSSFGVSAYFDDAQIVAISGEATSFTRGADSGRHIEANFCPRCGTTLYWRAEAMPTRLGVAVGCFNDPDFPMPGLAAWTKNIHGWIGLDDGIARYPEGGPASRKKS